MSQQKKRVPTIEGNQQKQLFQNELNLNNYHSIYNRGDFTLTEVVDMEKQIQRLKILFEFFDTWEAGLVYREQKEEELQEKIRISEQVSYTDYDEDGRNYQQSDRNSFRQQQSGKSIEAEMDNMRNKENILDEREQQLSEFEQDLSALKQEIIKKNQIIEREFQILERQKQQTIKENPHFNVVGNKQEFKVEESRQNNKQLEMDIYIKQEAQLESRFASVNEKELQAESDELELLRIQKEIDESRQQIFDKKRELEQIQNDMILKQEQLVKDLMEAQKKLETVTVQVDCVQNQQPSQFYKEKLLIRDQSISENDQKLAVKEEKLLKEILSLRNKCAQLHIPTNNLKLIDESLSATRCKTDSFSDVSHLPNPKSNLSFRNYANSTSSTSFLMQTPPNARNLSTEQTMMTTTQPSLPKFQIKRSQDSTNREDQRYSKVSQNDEYCNEIKLMRDNSQTDRDRSPAVNDLKMKLSSRKKELSAFLSPVHQNVRKFDANFIGSKEELDLTQGEVHQSYQNGYELFNTQSQSQSQLQRTSNMSTQNKSSLETLSPSSKTNNNTNQLQSQSRDQNSYAQIAKNKQLALQNKAKQDSQLNSSLTGHSHTRNGSVSMQEKILQQMKLNQQTLSSSKKSLKQLSQNQIDPKGITQSDAKVMSRNYSQKECKIVNLPQQNQLEECRDRVNSMTNSQKIKNKILKFSPSPKEKGEIDLSTHQGNLLHEQQDRTNQISYKKNGSSGIPLGSSSNNINNTKQQDKIQQREQNQYSNNSNHHRTFSFANVGTSQEIASGSAISSQQSVGNLFNFRNSSMNASSQSNKQFGNKQIANAQFTSDKKYSQKDENINPKSQNQNIGYRIKIHQPQN